MAIQSGFHDFAGDGGVLAKTYRRFSNEDGQSCSGSAHGDFVRKWRP